ncbi:MAG TPA: toll/interleukin-1 receptor domain-containing protein [Actinomycetota bacterium]|nr:toll/interleukin-1 receptor domain-containing protein [Actinomycetota bacterium]
MSIFISYRRDDTRYVAGRLYDRLINTFGKDRIFRDVYSIPAGEDFPTWIKEAVSSANVVVALIGDRWATIASKEHERRIDDPEDWVRLEIATALEHETLVVPVLVEGAAMPDPRDLPEPLRALARHQTVSLSDEHFDADVAELIRVLRNRVPGFGSATVEGEFRQLGTFHLHVDGGDQPYIENLLGQLKPEFPSKLTRVLASIEGAQQNNSDFDESYRHHTPGAGEGDGFSVFSTTLLGTGAKLTADAFETIGEIIDGSTRKRGLVVELERVVATIDEHGQWDEVEVIPDPPDLWKMADERVYPRLSTFPIEIHHAIDVPKSASATPPLDLKRDLPKGPNVGGWVLLEKEDTWAYRSNQFADWSDYDIQAKDGDARLRATVAKLGSTGIEAKLRTLVEQVLGIWRQSDDKVRRNFKSVPDLARWEMKCPEFWVVAASFLGDKSPDVKNAMVQNLRNGVTYTYFVRSYADVFRLNMLRNELEKELCERLPGRISRLVAEEKVRNQIRCVLLHDIHASLKQLLEPDYFICPRASEERDVEGYELKRGAIGGEKLEDAQVTKIIEGLQPLLQQKIEAFFLSVPQEPWRPFDDPENYAVVCTDLDGSRVPGGFTEWQEVLALYDQIVARQVSMFRSGDVVRPVRNGYLLVFKTLKDAADFAKRLESSIDWHNEASRREVGRDRLPPQTIALEYGTATRVLRAHGDDYIGPAVEACIRQLDVCEHVRSDAPASVIGVSSTFARLYKDRYGEDPFPGRTRAAEAEWAIFA